MSDTPSPSSDSLEKLNEDFRIHVDEAKFKDPWTVQAEADALLARRQALARGDASGNQIPPGEAAPGAPPTESPPGIDVATLPPLPDGETWQSATVNSFADWAKEMGLDGNETKEWLDFYANSLTTDAPDQDAAERELRQEWGESFDAKLAAAKLAYARLSWVVRQRLGQEGFEDDPKVIRRLAAIGEPLLRAHERINAIYAGKVKAGPEELRRLFVVLAGTRPVLKL